MSQKKRNLFSDEDVSLAAFAGALSHPARISIVKILQSRKQAYCGEIVGLLPLAQSTISQHLDHLLKVGLVSRHPCGQKICYRLEQDTIRNFCHHFQCTLGTDQDHEVRPETTKPSFIH